MKETIIKYEDLFKVLSFVHFVHYQINDKNEVLLVNQQLYQPKVGGCTVYQPRP